MQKKIEEMVHDESRVMKDSSQDLLSTVDTSLNVQVTLAIFGLVMGVLVALVISRLITQPLNSTVVALQQAAAGDGDLTRRLKSGSADELADLACAFNQLSAKQQPVRARWQKTLNRSMIWHYNCKI